jgi:hypothetical protein
MNMFLSLLNLCMQDKFDSNDYDRLSKIIPAIKGLAILMIVMYHLLIYSNNYSINK